MPTPLTVTIPLRTLAVGTAIFGPVNLTAGYHLAVITLDRTVVGGLDATPTTVVAMHVEQSDDSGATWHDVASADTEGGLFFNHFGPATQSILTLSLPGVAAQVRAVLDVAVAAVAVSGSLAVT